AGLDRSTTVAWPPVGAILPAEPASQWPSVLMSKASPLDRTGEQPPHEVSLEGEEHDQRDHDGDECPRREQLPAPPERAAHLCQPDRQRCDVRRTAGERETDQQVVPDPQELEDRERRQGRG